MPRDFDVAVIGAGPSAIACLAALPDRLQVAVFTGEAKEAESKAVMLPAKIRAVSHERAEPAGVDSFVSFASRQSGLYRTAIAGGLANYWGQMLARYAGNDPWPSEFFASHAAYLEACARIEGLFVRSPQEVCPETHCEEGYFTRTPSLVVGTPDEPSCGLLATRKAFARLVETRDATVFDGVVRGWEDAGDFIHVHLGNVGVIRSRKVLLAAGVVGSLRLAMASCPEVGVAALKDHAPLMFHVLGLRRHVDLDRSDGFLHFNSLTIEAIEEARVRLFASVYRMSRAPFGLLFAALGFPPAFSGIYPPGLIDWMTPVQVWTEKTFMSYRLRRGAQIECEAMPQHDADEELQRFAGWLRDRGLLLKRAPTLPGEGFHYHAGEISLNGTDFMSLSAFLENRFRGRVVSADASLLPNIGCRPHTLTAMTAAYANVVRTVAASNF